MATQSERLPSRFPVGTKFVLEGRPDGKGRLRIFSRYVEFPDGRHIDLLGGRAQRRARRGRASRRASSCRSQSDH